MVAAVMWGNSGTYVLITITCAIAFLSSSLMPLGMAIGHHHITLTSGLMTILHLTIQIYHALYDWLMGYLIDMYDISIYFNVLLGGSLITCLLVVIYRSLVIVKVRYTTHYDNFE